MSQYAEAILQLVDLFRGERRYNRELRDQALGAINIAVVATRKYEAKFGESSGTDPEAQAEIGGLWLEAARQTRDVSEDFTSVLHDKAMYWFQNFEWGPEEVKDRRIDWDSIDAEIRELLTK